MSAQISPLDRGLHYGDGLFETLACPRGQPRFLELHLARLCEGCRRLKINPPDPIALSQDITAAARGSESPSVEDCLVKVIVTRGVAQTRSYRFSGSEIATTLVLRYPWPEEPPQASDAGVWARIAALRLGESPALAGIKHLNRLEQVLARAEWPDPDVAEVLLFSSSGRLVSGTMSNVFIVKNQEVRTPRVTHCGVAGIMRGLLLREAPSAGMPISECELVAADLEAAEEIFLTNARIGIWPVRQMNDRVLGAGAVTRRLQRLLMPLLGASTGA